MPGRAVAGAYRANDPATRSADRPPAGEPLWLPSGWLLVVLLLTAAAPAFGETTTTGSSGWRARGSAPHRAMRAPLARRLDGRLRTVAYEDDIAGPALRVASRPTDGFGSGYRVAQADDPLSEALERPFGVDPDTSRPTDAGDLYDNLPADDRPSEDPFERGPFANEPRAADDDDDMADAAPQDEYRSSDPSDEEQADDPYYSDYDAEDIAAPLGAPRKADERLETERRVSEKACAEELADLKSKTLATIDLSIGVKGVEGEDYPFACSIEDGSIGAPRCWAEITYLWKASASCHKPLYFEDVHLERYGHSWGPFLDPFVSGAHFFGRLPVLPYCIGLKTPNECVYTLGHYRPGDCAPYHIGGFPFTWRAALFQAGGVVGAAAILP